jgi:hypothetical protein
MLWRTRVVVCYSTEAFDNDWSGYSIKFDTRSIHIRQRSCRSAGQIQQANGSEHAFCSDAWELAHRKPFLMQVIATVAFFHDLPKQQVMVKDLMRQISEKMILRNDKSLELLQGILILIAW